LIFPSNVLGEKGRPFGDPAVKICRSLTDQPEMRNFLVEQQKNRRRLHLLLAAWALLALGASWVAGKALEKFAAPNDAMRRLEEPGWSPPFLKDQRYQLAGAFLALAYVLARRAWRDADRTFLTVTRARPLEDQTARNIAEEMAIAAGVPIPELYVVEDPVPNAFALGVRRTPEERGTIVLTRGLLESLTRSELQAVIAHEVGHLRAGDARLMTTLLGLSRAVQLLSRVALGPLRALWGAPSSYDIEVAHEESARIADSSETPPLGTSQPPASNDLPSWLLPKMPKATRIVAFFVGVIVLGVATPVISIALSLASLYVVWVVLRMLPFAAFLWAIWETFRPGERVHTASEALTDEPSTRSGAIPFYLFVPVGIITGPAILILGALLPLVAALGRVVMSRNREFDADVTAVELTRNPVALAGALRSISRHSIASRVIPRWLTPLTIAPMIQPDNGQDDDLLVCWRQWWSGSPPLAERIRRIDEMARGASARVNSCLDNKSSIHQTISV